MEKKSQKLVFTDENRLAIFLVLADYPEYQKRSFLFEYLKNIHPERYGAIEVIKMLSKLQKRGNIEMKEFVFDKFSTMTAENPEWRMETIRRISKNKSPRAQKVLDKILSSTFNFSDLEFALKEYKNCFWEIADNIDFEIQIAAEEQEKIVRIIKTYAELFIKGRLKTDDANRLNYEEHKKEVFKIIGNDPEIFTKNLAYQKEDFDSIKGFRFFEFFLALEQDRFIEINSVVPTKNKNGKSVFPLGFTLAKKYFERTARKIQKELPVPREFAKMGDIYWPRKKKKKNIDEIVTRHWKLVKFLLRARFDNPRPIEEAFEAIKDGRHHKTTRSYRKLEFGAIKDAVEKLRKIGIDPLVIEFNEKTICLK